MDTVLSCSFQQLPYWILEGLFELILPSTTPLEGPQPHLIFCSNHQGSRQGSGVLVAEVAERTDNVFVKKHILQWYFISRANPIELSQWPDLKLYQLGIEELMDVAEACLLPSASPSLAESRTSFHLSEIEGCDYAMSVFRAKLEPYSRYRSVLSSWTFFSGIHSTV